MQGYSNTTYQHGYHESRREGGLPFCVTVFWTVLKCVVLDILWTYPIRWTCSCVMGLHLPTTLVQVIPRCLRHSYHWWNFRHCTFHDIMPVSFKFHLYVKGFAKSISHNVHVTCNCTIGNVYSGFILLLRAGVKWQQVYSCCVLFLFCDVTLERTVI